MRARKESPSDFHLAGLGKLRGVAGGADDGTACPITDNERATRCESFLEVDAEDCFLVAIRLRMQHPDERIGCGGMQLSPVVRNERPFTEILTADYTVVNPFSAIAYGVDSQIQFTDKLDEHEFHEAHVAQVNGPLQNKVESLFLDPLDFSPIK